MDVWVAHRLGFGSIPELYQLRHSKNGARIFHDFFLAQKAQSNVDDRSKS